MRAGISWLRNYNELSQTEKETAIESVRDLLNRNRDIEDFEVNFETGKVLARKDNLFEVHEVYMSEDEPRSVIVADTEKDTVDLVLHEFNKLG